MKVVFKIAVMAVLLMTLSSHTVLQHFNASPVHYGDGGGDGDSSSGDGGGGSGDGDGNGGDGT